MDSRLHTFLTLCNTMNYRIAAEQLHLSQPAVTKQIQALEQGFGTKLFRYDGHTLHKNGDEIDIALLSKKLGCPIVEISALRLEGIEEAAEAADRCDQDDR